MLDFITGGDCKKLELIGAYFKYSGALMELRCALFKSGKLTKELEDSLSKHLDEIIKSMGEIKVA